jgi:osmoprotectant transport system substrate-binding protein
MSSFVRRWQAMVVMVIVGVMIAACGTTAPAAQPTAASAPAQPTAAAVGGDAEAITIGSKDFTEAILVAELYAQMLEQAGLTVDRKLSLGATPIAQAAMVKGDIDLYPEYTSTGLQEVLKIEERITDPKQIWERVRTEYEKQFQITWLEPSPFNNTNAFAVTKETADKFGLKTYSDLVTKAAELRLGAPAEFPDRQDTKGLEGAYGAFVGTFKEFKPLGTGSLRYDALKNGEVDVIVAFTTDARIAGDSLVVLEDDKNFYPVYNIAPVVRQDTLQQFPQIAETINKLSPLLDDQTMARLNFEVDGPAKKEIKEVAKAFLIEKGLAK